MSSPLKTNTETIQNLINQINALPDAETGGSVETCEVTISADDAISAYWPINVAYTSVDSSGNLVGAFQTVSTKSVTITCIKGTIVSIKYNGNLNITSRYENASLLFYSSLIAIYKLSDNATTAKILNQAMSSGGGV